MKEVVQHYGAGVPTVCTSAGVKRDVVRNGINGFWDKTDEKWIAKRSILIKDPLLRQKVGLHGRELVRESYFPKVPVISRPNGLNVLFFAVNCCRMNN